ncbi:SIS domain-containing protein [Saccharibacillus sp. CPCC 101409]|uniref:SIS domain-containing protein n=1 Tax=Saccharibacillus sp. CPCC 101409 TaxID=3058041 RepID=UPI002672B8B6|nr:SIS domain-containing protein [Saccharibacillus sp. CPCC 101409]MDO3411125.1 SIS domain-containing protein [Saccharibacillus sp. CPCC 101409]
MIPNTLPDFLGNLHSEISRLIISMDQAAIGRARDLIFQAERGGGRVHVTGIGKPGHVAGYAASLLSSTGTPAYELHGTEAVHGSSGQVLPGDVVIAISNSGETEELKATIETLKRNGAKIIAVTGNPSSWLADRGDEVLVAGVKTEGDPLNKPPRASIVAEIIMLQSLSILLQDEKDLTPEKYVKWHPGGTLGKSVNK